MLAAQAPAATSTSAPAHKPLHTHTRPSAAHPLTPPAAAAPAPAATPAVLEAPHWPANDRPVEASVVWDSQGLSIDAQNSSLEQILRDFSTATGAKVEGLASDERVFGFYGPGQARDVLSQLLQGSGYNVIMIGDQGQGAPRQIVLSVRQAGAAQPPRTTRQAATTMRTQTNRRRFRSFRNPSRRPSAPASQAALRSSSTRRSSSCANSRFGSSRCSSRGNRPAIRRTRSVVSGQLSVLSYRWSVIRNRGLPVRFQIGSCGDGDPLFQINYEATGLIADNWQLGHSTRAASACAFTATGRACGRIRANPTRRIA
jgi:hypothetical protein